MKRDLTYAQFEYRARKLGFTPEGFLGYWRLPLSDGSAINVSVYNAGTRRRDWLRYLVSQRKKHSPVESDKGEQCVYCGKDSWTCEHFKPEEQENETPYHSLDEGRNPDGSGESFAERNA